MHEWYGAAALRSSASVSGRGPHSRSATMRRFVSTLVAAVAAPGIVAMAAPAGAAQGTDPSEWASGFCTAVEDWQSSALAARDVVDGVIDNGVASSSKAKAARKQLVNSLKDARSSSQDAGDAIKELGPPDVWNG